MADTSIKVCVRFRPQNSREKAEGGQVCVVPKGETGLTITTTEGGTKPPQEKDFNFDRVFMMDSAQDTVFNYVAKPVLDDCFAGFNGTVFAYGQTGSGKTHTMMGTGIDDPVGRGIIPRVMFSLFDHISSAPPTTDFVVKVNYVEIYMERVKDLIDTTKNNLSIREDPKRGIYIQDVTDTYITSPQDAFDVMATGDRNRVVAFTQMNAGSSRSHSIFTLNIEVTDNEKGTINNSKLNLVDLAGSEKIAKTGAEGQQLEEAKKINQSLSALGNVINALTDPNSKHVPYRDSKLTRILQESLGGNAKTTLIVCCSSSSWNDFETVSSLRFGMRAKNIKNKVEANTELSKEQMKRIIRELEIKVKNYEEYIKYLEGGGAPDPSFKAKNNTNASSNNVPTGPEHGEYKGENPSVNVREENASDNSNIPASNQGTNGVIENAISKETNDNSTNCSGTNDNTDAVSNAQHSSAQKGSLTSPQQNAGSSLTSPNSVEISPGTQSAPNEYIHILQEKVISLESAVQSTSNELESYKMLHDDLYAELVSGEETRTQLEKEIEKLKTKNDEMEKKQEKLKNLEEEYNSLKELYASISAEHEEETIELANEIDSLRNELTQKRIELRNMQNKMELVADEKSTGSGKGVVSNEAIEVERASWNVERLKHEEEVRNLNSEIEDLREEIRELQAYLEETELKQEQARIEMKQQLLPNNNANNKIQQNSEPLQYQMEQKLPTQQINSNNDTNNKFETLTNVMDQQNTNCADTKTLKETNINNPEFINVNNGSMAMSPKKETLANISTQQLASPTSTPEINGTVVQPKEYDYYKGVSITDQSLMMKSPLLQTREAKFLEESITESKDGHELGDIREKQEINTSHYNNSNTPIRVQTPDGNIMKVSDGQIQTPIVNTINPPNPIDYGTNNNCVNNIGPNKLLSTDNHKLGDYGNVMKDNKNVDNNNQQTTPSGFSVQNAQSLKEQKESDMNSNGTNVLETATPSILNTRAQKTDGGVEQELTPRGTLRNMEKGKTLLSNSQKDSNTDKTIADLKNQNKELMDKLATSKLEAAEMVKSLYTKISEKVSENMRLKVLLEENNISYGEDEGSAAKRNSILSKRDEGSSLTTKQSNKEKHNAYIKERDELKRKNMTLTRNMTNLTEEYEKAISQYNALSLNYKIEKNKALKELSRKDMELEQMSKVLTYRTIHEGEIQKKLDEMIEINEMLRKSLEEKMRNVVVGGARVIRGGGSQFGIRGGSGYGMSGGGGNSGNVVNHGISGGGNVSSTNTMRSQLSIDIPRTPNATASGVTTTNTSNIISPNTTNTPLSAYKSASCRSFMTQSRIATSSTTSAVNSPLVSASASSGTSQESTPVGVTQRRKSFSGLRRRIESSKN